MTNRRFDGRIRAAEATDDDLLYSVAGDRWGVHDLRKAVRSIAKRAGFEEAEIGSKAFRHAYCFARLQTLHREHSVSEFTVAREMGRDGFALGHRDRGHRVAIRRRSKVVE